MYCVSHNTHSLPYLEEPPVTCNRPTSKLLFTLLSLTLLLSAMPQQAHADLFGLWVKPKVDYINGSGDVFKRFEGSPAFGLEAGVELLSISLWGDYEKVGEEQYWASANIGYDLDLELIDDLTFMAGAYVGLIWFGFPPSDEAPEDNIKSTLKGTGLNDAQVMEFLKTYETFQKAEASTSNMAYGANARVRLSLEYEVLPFVSLGIEGLMGWHVVLSGEEAAAGVKAKAIESFISDQEDKLPDGTAPQLEAELKDKLGAQEIDTANLKGVHYTAGAFVSVRF